MTEKQARAIRAALADIDEAVVEEAINRAKDAGDDPEAITAAVVATAQARIAEMDSRTRSRNRLTDAQERLMNEIARAEAMDDGGIVH